MTDSAVLSLPLGQRAVIRFAGPDAERYLNGQVTQDIRPLADCRSSALACVTDAKGRLGTVVRIIAADRQTWFVEAPLKTSASLYDRLTRYLVADNVEATDVSREWHIIHFAVAPPLHLPGSALIRASDRFGADGYDLWLPVAQDIERLPSDPIYHDLFETRRIEAGVPEWGTDTGQDMFPAELGLDRAAVSFAKGCYIGQEVISRMQYTGKVNRRLTRLSLSPFLPAQTLCGAMLTVPENENHEQAGILTSFAPLLSEDGRRAALSMVKRPWLEASGFDIITSDGILHASMARALGPA